MIDCRLTYSAYRVRALRRSCPNNNNNNNSSSSSSSSSSDNNDDDMIMIIRGRVQKNRGLAQGNEVWEMRRHNVVCWLFYILLLSIRIIHIGGFIYSRARLMPRNK